MSNCDDPYESNFTLFFILKFRELKLKRFISTCYKGSPIAIGGLFKRITPQNNGYVLDITEKDLPSDDKMDGKTIIKYLEKNKCIKNLKGDGDFRSEECLAYLKEADIVITNPPFSLFREYIALLMEYNKKFLVIGSSNAVGYREIFTLMQDNKIWSGKNPVTKFFNNKTQEIQTFGNICWFTNLYIQKRYEKLILYKEYNINSDEYKDYDNYVNAINIDKIADIPNNCDKYMGVPMGFASNINPYQFKLIGLLNGGIKGLSGMQSTTGAEGPYIDGKLKFGRCVIKHRYIQNKNKLNILNDGFLHNSRNLYNFLENIRSNNEYKDYNISYRFLGNSFYLLDGNPFILLNDKNAMIDTNKLNYSVLSKSNFDFSGGTFIIEFLSKFISVYLEPQLRENIEFECEDKEVLFKFRKIIEENEKLVFGEL